MSDVCKISTALRHRLRWAVSACLIVLSACGGGGDPGGGQQAGVSSGGTGSFSSGSVTEMGSIVVTGVHFDQTTAKTITNADGLALTWRDIDLGMTVEVEGSDIVKRAGREEASSKAIRITSDLLGPVTAIEGDLLFVMGQPVRLNSKTFLRKKVGDAWQDMPREEITLQDIVEVHGFQDMASKGFVATRVELRKEAVNLYVLRGVVEELTAIGCRIGSQHVAYSWANTPSLSNGSVARALLYPAAYQGPGTNWKAQSMSLSQPLVSDHGAVRLNGVVTERESDTSFSVNGVEVDSAEPCAKCELGRYVEARGKLVNAVLKAEKVTPLAAP